MRQFMVFEWRQLRTVVKAFKFVVLPHVEAPGVARQEIDQHHDRCARGRPISCARPSVRLHQLLFAQLVVPISP
jgi:hypothetical protein